MSSDSSNSKSSSRIVTTILFIKRLLIITAVVLVGLLIYRSIIRNYNRDGNILVLFLLLWLFTAYYALPRIHRLLTKMYVPDYFTGRVRTTDGLLGDPVNLALNGTKPNILAAMEAAGWTRADELSSKSSLRIVTCTIRRKSYPQAPVSSLYLFNKKQDFAYQQEVAGSPSKRHHIRFWKVPEGWILPGGYKIDWLAAATYDKSVGLSLFTLQITHKIAEETDIERDYESTL